MTRARYYRGVIVALASLAIQLPIGSPAVIGGSSSPKTSSSSSISSRFLKSLGHADAEEVKEARRRFLDEMNSPSAETADNVEVKEARRRFLDEMNSPPAEAADNVRTDRTRQLSWWSVAINFVPTPTPPPTSPATPQPTRYPTPSPTNQEQTPEPTDEPTYRPTFRPTQRPTLPDLSTVIRQPDSAAFWFLVSQIVAVSSASAIALVVIVGSYRKCKEKSDDFEEAEEKPTYHHKMHGAVSQRLEYREMV